MGELTMLEASLAGLGAAAAVVWPTGGPVYRARERWLVPALRRVRLDGLAECVICSSFWTGLLIGLAVGQPLAALGSPALAWVGWMASEQGFSNKEIDDGTHFGSGSESGDRPSDERYDGHGS